MTRLWTKGRAAAAALGIIALVVAAGGAAFAASSGDGAITACVHKTGGGLYRAKHCAKHDARLSWSAAGPRGTAGPQGPAGTKGDTGAPGPQGAAGAAGSAAGWAYVELNGTVTTKGGAIDIAIHKIKTGEYCLKMTPKPHFSLPIVATIQGPDLTPGLISVNSGAGSDCNPDGGIGVFTMNPAGAAADHAFAVAVIADSVESGDDETA